MNPEPVFFSLLLSFAADILFLKTPFEAIAIVLFIAVQYCHRKLLSIPVRHFIAAGLGGTLFLLITCSFLHIKSSLLLAAAFFYISLLLCNLFSAWVLHADTTPLLLRICLAMLFICDLHVGLFNLPRFADLSSFAPLLFYCEQIADKLLWLFYLPSQLIMLYLFFCFLQQKPPAVLL